MDINRHNEIHSLRSCLSAEAAADLAKWKQNILKLPKSGKRARAYKALDRGFELDGPFNRGLGDNVRYEDIGVRKFPTYACAIGRA